MNIWRRVNAGSEWLAFKLALLFGFVWTVWTFFVVPLVAPYISLKFSAQVFYYGSGWVQLFALPLLTWIGNKTQALAEKQSEAQVELLTKVRSIVTENQRISRTIERLTTALAEHGIEPPGAD